MRGLMTFMMMVSALLHLAGGRAAARLPVQAQNQNQLQTTITPSPSGGIQILSPKPGSALQGSVPVIVDTTTQDFQGVELTFRYAKDSSETWFLIYQGIQPVTGTMLVLWDTSTITDGDYLLRLVVSFKDGSQKTVEAGELRVRNYTPVETSTPTQVEPTTTPAPASTLTPTVEVGAGPTLSIPSPTVLPVNPVVLSRMDVMESIGMGVLVIFGLFALGGFYTILLASRKKR